MGYDRPAPNFFAAGELIPHYNEEALDMGLGRGMLLRLIGGPLPIIVLLALFWHH